MVCAYSRRRIIPIHKKRAQFSLFCTPTKPFHRPVRIHEEKTRPVGRTFTHMPFGLKSGSISWERLVSVDANSRRGGFLPAAPKFCGFGPSLPPQNATNYTTNPSAKAHSSQNAFRPEAQIGSHGTKCDQPRGNTVSSCLRRAVPYLQPKSLLALRSEPSLPARGLTSPNEGFHFPQQSKRPCLYGRGGSQVYTFKGISPATRCGRAVPRGVSSAAPADS